jgi:hypothetical protein
MPICSGARIARQRIAGKDRLVVKQERLRVFQKKLDEAAALIVRFLFPQ